jgi:hypothetical protein
VALIALYMLVALLFGIRDLIANAFASGLAAARTLGGREVVCPPSDLGGKQIMSALERFVDDNPDLADQPYGVANDERRDLRDRSLISKRQECHFDRHSGRRTN